MSAAPGSPNLPTEGEPKINRAFLMPEVTPPPGWSVRTPDERDVPRLAKLAARVTRAGTGGDALADVAGVAEEITGPGSWTRIQTVALDPDGVVRAWAAATDRAAGRTAVQVTVDTALEPEIADPLAETLFGWAEKTAVRFPSMRRLEGTQLDSGAYARDERQQRWLTAAGYENVRTWLQMSRPVTEDDLRTSGEASRREGVDIRRVRRHTNGLPFARDVQDIHRVLEESFADHFNSYRESFPEFVHRLQAETGHSWDQWWIAYVDTGKGWLPGGAVVSSVLGPDSEGVQGSYIDYIGVHRLARGRGLAKALLHTVIADAAERRRNRVGLEVDADHSPAAGRHAIR